MTMPIALTLLFIYACLVASVLITWRRAKRIRIREKNITKMMRQRINQYVILKERKTQ